MPYATRLVLPCSAVQSAPWFCVDEPDAAPESDRRVSPQYSMAAAGGGGGAGDLGRLATGHGCGRVSGGSGSGQGRPGLACRPASAGHHTGPVTGPACTAGRRAWSTDGRDGGRVGRLRRSWTFLDRAPPSRRRPPVRSGWRWIR